MATLLFSIDVIFLFGMVSQPDANSLTVKFLFVGVIIYAFIKMKFEKIYLLVLIIFY